MSKTTTVIVVIILIAAALGAYWLATGSKSATYATPAVESASTTTPATADTPAMAAVRAQAAADLAVDPSAVTIAAVAEKSWPDSCLGLPAAGEMCSQVVTPGYLITITTAEGAQITYRTNLDGSVVRHEEQKG